jgi:hypothetical protein
MGQGNNRGLSQEDWKAPRMQLFSHVYLHQLIVIYAMHLFEIPIILTTIL